MTIRVLLARHGETAYESPLMVDAGGSLTATGRQQARELGHRLRGQGVGHVWCSTKARAVQTAELAAAELGVEVTVREQLREIGPGGWFGEPEDVARYDPIFAAWLAGDLDAGVPGGETGRDVATRMMTVLDEVADLTGNGSLVITHGGAMLAVVAAVSPGSPSRPAHGLDVANCAVVGVERVGTAWSVAAPSGR